MIRFLLYFITLIALALLASLLASLDGQFELRIGTYIISTRAGIAVGLGLAIIAIAIIIALFGKWLVSLPAHLKTRRRTRTAKQSEAALANAFTALTLGDNRNAAKYAHNARTAMPNNHTARLIEAQAAQNAGDIETARANYQALLNTPENTHKNTAQAGLFQIALRKGDLIRAADIAQNTLDTQPKTFWAAEGMFQLAARHAQWETCLNHLKLLQRMNTIDHHELTTRQAIIHLAIAQTAHKNDQTDIALKHAEKAYSSAPDLIPAISFLAILTAQGGNIKKARSHLVKAWQKTPHPNLADAFITCHQGQAATTRNANLRQFIQKTSAHIETHILRARIAILTKNYAQASRILAPYVKQPSKRIAHLMANIAKGKSDMANAHEWSERATHAPQDAGWYAADGATRLKTWYPVCPVSGKFNGVQWKTPASALRADAAETNKNETQKPHTQKSHTQKSETMPRLSQSP